MGRSVCPRVPPGCLQVTCSRAAGTHLVPCFSWHPPQVTFKNLRLMNGNSKNGFGGAVEVFGPVDVTFIDCEFGGSVSKFGRSASMCGSSEYQ